MNKRRAIESTSTSSLTSVSIPTSASTSTSDDEYYELFGDEPQKGEAALALLLSSMQWEAVDDSTMRDLRSITRANGLAKDAFMRSKEITTTSNKKIPSKKQNKDEKSLDIRKFKKCLLGLDTNDCELPILPPMEKLRGSVGRCSKPFMKVLTLSDVNPRHCRLILVRSYAIHTILPLLDKQERRQLEANVKIDVTVFDQDGKEYAMMFHKWANGKFYVLRGANWKAFVKEKALEGCNDWVSVWSFRHLKTGRLCFAILIKRIPTEEVYPC